MIRGSMCLLLFAAAALPGEDLAFGTVAVEDHRTAQNDDEILEQDIDDWIDRENVRDQGWQYDPTEIFEKPAFEVSLGLWSPRLSGPLTVRGQEVINVSDGLGLGGTQVAGTAGVSMKYDIWEAILDFYTTDFDGARVLEEQITVPTEPPIVVGVNGTISTKLEVTNVRLLGGWRFWRRPKITASLLLGLSMYNFAGHINFDNADRINFSQIVPIPVLGLAVYGNLLKSGRLMYRFEVVGIAVEIKTFGGNLVDARATVGYRVTGQLWVRGGYRYANIGAFFQNINVDFEIQGPFLELALTF